MAPFIDDREVVEPHSRSIPLPKNEAPLLEETLAEAFATTAARYPDKIAIVDSRCTRRVSFRQVNEQATAAATGLQARGISKGDRVATSLGNTLEGCVSILACYKLGAIAVPLNPSYKLPQPIGALRHVTAKCLIIGFEAKLPFRDPVSNIPLLHSLVNDIDAEYCTSEQVPTLEHIVVVNNTSNDADIELPRCLTSWKELLQQRTILLTDLGVTNNDVALIQFTSGTTSNPKGACLTHRNILNAAALMGQRLNYTHEDVVCCPLPLFHISGTTLGLAISQYHGTTLVLPSEAFNTAATVEALRSENATSIYGVPTMYVGMLEYINQHAIPTSDFARLRTGIISGSPVHSSLLHRVHDVLHLPELAVCSGMSETSGAATMSHRGDPTEKRINTVGRSLPHTRVRVVDRKDPWREMPRGERGELAVSGYLLMKEYWQDPKATAAVHIRDPLTGEVWMRTGDEGVQDEDGFFDVTGRIKDIIIRGGENIHPSEIENILIKHPLVSDASVIGIPDEKYGEVVGAFVVLKPNTGAHVPDKEEMGHWTSLKVGKTWVPKEIFFVQELPKTPSGKIMKHELRSQAKALLEKNRRDSHQTEAEADGWADGAKAYSTSIHRASTAAAQRLVEMACELRPIDQASHVIDVGAGAGAVTLSLLDKAPATRIVATDLAGAMLDRIEVGHRLEKHIVDAYALSYAFPAGCFTHTFSNMMLHILTDPMTAVQQLYEVTKKSSDGSDSRSSSGVLALGITGTPIYPYLLWERACQRLDPAFKLSDPFPDRWSTAGDLWAAFRELGARDVHVEVVETEWKFESGEEFARFMAEGRHPGFDKAVKEWTGDQGAAMKELVEC